MSCDVLVLDDEAVMRELLTEVLTGAGLLVRAAATVHAAQLALRDGGTRLLIADKALGAGQDGHVLAREAMRLHPGLLVLYISGMPEALRGVGLTPRERFLSKPFSAAIVVELAQAMVRPEALSLTGPRFAGSARSHPFASMTASRI